MGLNSVVIWTTHPGYTGAIGTADGADGRGGDGLGLPEAQCLGRRTPPLGGLKRETLKQQVSQWRLGRHFGSSLLSAKTPHPPAYGFF